MPSNHMTHKRMQSAGPQYIHEINNENTHLNPWSSNRKISCADKFYDWSSMQSSTKQPPLLVFLQDEAADKYTDCIVIICLHFVSTYSTLQQAAQPHEHVAQLANDHCFMNVSALTRCPPLNAVLILTNMSFAIPPPSEIAARVNSLLNIPAES